MIGIDCNGARTSTQIHSKCLSANNKAKRFFLNCAVILMGLRKLLKKIKYRMLLLDLPPVALASTCNLNGDENLGAERTGAV